MGFFKRKKQTPQQQAQELQQLRTTRIKEEGLAKLRTAKEKELSLIAKAKSKGISTKSKGSGFMGLMSGKAQDFATGLESSLNMGNFGKPPRKKKKGDSMFDF